MIVADISDQLGNQMFAYASVKTIAEHKGYSFGFIRAHNDRINDSDKQYGNEIHTIFPNISDEFLNTLPSSVTHTYIENINSNTKTFYSDSALSICDNTYMKGHFISYRYFNNNMEKVRQWFTFTEEIRFRCLEKLNEVKHRYPDKTLIAIHFRIGEDYLRQGFLLDSSYWFQAAEHMVKKYGKGNILFLPFYDFRSEKGGIINRFLQKYPCEIIRGSLVEDMCCLTMIRDLIVCNSSFSIMAGILNDSQEKTVVRPSVYPAGSMYQPTDCFPDEWTVIEAKRSRYSYAYYQYMRLKGFLLKIIRH